MWDHRGTTDQDRGRQRHPCGDDAANTVLADDDDHMQASARRSTRPQLSGARPPSRTRVVPNVALFTGAAALRRRTHEARPGCEDKVHSATTRMLAFAAVPTGVFVTCLCVGGREGDGVAGEGVEQRTEEASRIPGGRWPPVHSSRQGCQTAPRSVRSQPLQHPWRPPPQCPRCGLHSPEMLPRGLLCTREGRRSLQKTPAAHRRR